MSVIMQKDVIEKWAKPINPQDDVNLYPLDDFGSGQLFADTFSEIAKYVPDKGCWYVYDGVVWEEDARTDKVRRLARWIYKELAKLDKTSDDMTDFLRWLSSRSGRNTMIKEAECISTAKSSDFDKSPNLFNCLNCTLDLDQLKTSKTLKPLDHNPKHMLTTKANAVYDPKAKSERWIRFVDEVMCDDADMVRYLQKSLGYSLSGDNSLECLFLAYGPTTRNGKGTTFGTVLHLMGDYGKILSPRILAQRSIDSNRPSPALARLSKARFVNVSEPDKGLKLNVGFTKVLTGRDTIDPRMLGKNPEEYQPQFIIYINTNHHLEIDDATLFDSDRAKMLLYSRHFEEIERDTGLKSELKTPENISGILNWLIEGYKFLLDEGLTPPKVAVDALKKYRESADTISLFMETMTTKTDDDKQREKTNTLYQVYKQWCSDYDTTAKSQKEFVAALRNKGLVERHGADGHIVKSCQLKQTEQPAEQEPTPAPTPASAQ